MSRASGGEENRALASWPQEVAGSCPFRTVRLPQDGDYDMDVAIDSLPPSAPKAVPWEGRRDAADDLLPRPSSLDVTAIFAEMYNRLSSVIGSG